MLLLVKHFQQVVRHSGPDASEQGSTHYDKSYYPRRRHLIRSLYFSSLKLQVPQPAVYAHRGSLLLGHVHLKGRRYAVYFLLDAGRSLRHLYAVFHISALFVFRHSRSPYVPLCQTLTQSIENGIPTPVPSIRKNCCRSIGENAFGAAGGGVPGPASFHVIVLGSNLSLNHS